MIISYFSIVIGELTAKRLAMQSAETFAMALAPLVNAIATITRPVIWFLGVSTNALVRVLGGDPKASREEVTDEELRAMVTSSSTLGDEERQIVDEVFAAGQVSLREAMVPRTEVDFLSGDLPAHKAIRSFQEHPHSRYPVIGEDVDDVLGFVHVRDLFDLDPAARNAPVGQLVRPVVSLPHTMKILRALSEMRAANAHLVIVRDEYGGTAGIVTMEDLVEELVGDISDEFDQPSLGSDDSPGQRRARRPGDPRGVRRGPRLRAARGPLRHGGRLRDGPPGPAAGGGRRGRGGARSGGGVRGRGGTVRVHRHRARRTPRARCGCAGSAPPVPRD